MSNSQWWFATYSQATGATTYASVLGGYAENGNGGKTTEPPAQVPCPVAGNALTLKVWLTVAPGGGQSRTVALSINGTPSALSVTISGTDTSGTSTGTISISAQDLLALKHTASAGAASTEIHTAVEFAPTTDNYFSYPFHGWGGQITGADFYTNPVCGSTQSTTTGLTGARRLCMPCDGTIRALAVSLQVAPGAGTSWDFGFYIEGTGNVGSALNVADANTSGILTGLSIAVSKGDLVSIRVRAKNGAAANTNVKFGVTIEPSKASEFIVGQNSAALESSSIYWRQQGGGTTGMADATESNVQIHWPVSGLSILGLGVALSNAPAGGTSVTVTQRIPSGDGTVTVTLSSSDTSKSTRSLAVHDDPSSGDLVDLHAVHTGSTGNTAPSSWAVSVLPTLNIGSPSTRIPAVIG